MHKKLIITLAVLCCFCLKALADTDTILSNDFFSFTMPYDTKGTYNYDKFDNGIYITEKVSEQAGLIGFAFGLKVFRSPDEYVSFDGNKKIGELIDKNGVIYDMVLMRPTDVQLADGDEIQKNYDRLYNYGNNVDIKGINGNKYFKGKGMKGEELYSEVIKKYKKAFNENWDCIKYKNEDMGSAYYNLKNANPDADLMKETGYAYYDINSDGIDELIIGTNKNKKSFVYDIYTMVNRKPAHITSGDDSNKLFVCNDSFLCNQYSSNVTENILNVYIIQKNSTKQVLWLGLNHNSDKNAKVKWSASYVNMSNWEPISKKEYNVNFKTYTKYYKKFDFTPFSE